MTALAGKRIWVTRPAGQAAALLALLQAQGALPLALPLLEIVPPTDPAPLQQALARLASYDLAAFVSPSALDAVCSNLPQGWPTQLTAAVVGPGSAQRAREYGIAHLITPAARYDSAGLLAEPAMTAFAGRRIVLFRGEQGRELLVDGLRALSADLAVVPAYRRLPPKLDESQLATELDAGCDGIIISSSEAAQHLFAAVGAALRERLQSMHYFAPHPRIVAALAQQGVQRITLCQAGDAGIVATLLSHFAEPYPP
ncbi:uroporphyrinogen-III synthase [Andreprevotia lacus DSM 23236]|jgi:uroporphyrinogen-III synthase|uniref:Uroporphyrinogen-III synthase n=1 Tax=Andreprevotia lacus DSM 23236 TaxID=1121001 RepID=A0A1W1XC53_9NEIS|nr:uroporphyrinogen-III synthase [Andreprevotia lacus]SMC21453.1 uroporphyrinogen-III synthase [Andreprevotia lacus DSM 23236]